MAEFGYGAWTVSCPQCGEERIIRAHKYKDGRVRGAEHGCHPCRAINLQKRISITCPACGSVRILTESDSKQRLSAYCTRCVKTHSSKKRSDGRHVNVTSRGYIVVVGMVGHPLAKHGQVLEHWLTLYEQHPMGKESVLWFKEHGFTVHHKNGRRSENDIDNLELRAPGRHPAGWTINEMREVVMRYDNQKESKTPPGRED